jgi:hypothetical protein
MQLAVSRPMAAVIVNSTLSFVSGHAEYVPTDLLGQRQTSPVHNIIKG